MPCRGLWRERRGHCYTAQLPGGHSSHRWDILTSCIMYDLRGRLLTPSQCTALGFRSTCSLTFLTFCSMHAETGLAFMQGGRTTVQAAPPASHQGRQRPKR